MNMASPYALNEKSHDEEYSMINPKEVNAKTMTANGTSNPRRKERMLIGLLFTKAPVPISETHLLSLQNRRTHHSWCRPAKTGRYLLHWQLPRRWQLPL